jgi:transcriptional regulator with XRE-family HTH domain
MPVADMTTFGRNVRNLRHARNWSRERLADHVADYLGNEPDSANTIGQIERGARSSMMRIDRLQAFAHVLGVTIDRLFDTTDCGTCNSRPPRYFTCRVCGKEG